MQSILNISHPARFRSVFQLLCVKGLNLLSREFLQLDMAEARDKMTVYDDTAVPIGTKTHRDFIHILKPVLKKLRQRLLRPSCNDALSQLIQNRSTFLQGLFLCPTIVLLAAM